MASLKQKYREEDPLFVHNFWSLRRECLEHTNIKLRKLQDRVLTLQSDERDIALDEAAELLTHFDRMVRNATKMLQMEDPEYAAARGVSVVHFATASRDRSAEWTMLSKPSGRDSGSLPENDIYLLPELFKSRIEEFTNSQHDTEVHFRRPKSSAEQQPGTIIYQDGTIARRPMMVHVWRIAILFAIVALAAFLGVGIIATNTTFNPLFQKYFFWIALGWVFFSSTLLIWLVNAFGGNKRDMLSSFLAAVGIWLVVIQIGQTHLLTQQHGV